MKWIRRLFFGNSKAFPSDDRISDLSVDEEGNISATVTLSVNGRKLAIPLSTNAEELEQIQRNKNNPNSCEREPAEDEIKIPVSFLTVQNIVYAGKESELFRLSIFAKRMGYNYVLIKKHIYIQAIKNITRGRRLDYSIQRSAKLNLLGIEYEKAGNIEDAIKVYEENIAMRSNGRHSYDRLKIIYRRQKDRENEIRVLQTAISVFGKGSEYNERLLKLLSKPNTPV